MKQAIIIIILTLLPMMASADPVEINGIYYNLIGKGKVAEVTSNPNRYSGDIHIPDSITYEGIKYEVATICSYAFYENCDVTSITIPKTIKSFGIYALGALCDVLPIYISDLEAWCKIEIINSENQYRAIGSPYRLFLNGIELDNLNIPNTILSINEFTFEGCISIKTVNIPNSVTSIGFYAFAGCTNITSVTIGNNVTIIHPYAFSGCTGLTSISIPNNVTSLSGFNRCTGLTSVNIPNSVTSIGISAFLDCTGLTSVTIPNSVTSIESYAFSNCSGLPSIMIPNSVTSIGMSAFSDCTGLTSVTIPNSVTFIGGGAFRGCTGLTSVTIPNSVMSIGDWAFANCDYLADVYCMVEQIKKDQWNGIGLYTCPNAFEGSYPQYITLHVPATTIEVYRNVNPWSKFKNIVALSETPHTLSYVVDNTDYKSYQLYEGEVIIPIEEPTKEGYTFSGWNNIPSVMPAHDITVTGNFTISKYKLTYIVDGEEYKSYELEEGTTITPETTPTKDGYSFSGWSDIPATMPANDVTVNGTFTKDPLGKCATPTIDIDNGKLIFSCETEDVQYHYEIMHSDVKNGEGNNIELTNTYTIRVYSYKEDYDNSETVTTEIKIPGGKLGDLNGDGKVDVADHVKLSDIIMGNR